MPSKELEQVKKVMEDSEITKLMNDPQFADFINSTPLTLFDKGDLKAALNVGLIKSIMNRDAFGCAVHCMCIGYVKEHGEEDAFKRAEQTLEEPQGFMEIIMGDLLKNYIAYQFMRVAEEGENNKQKEKKKKKSA